MEVERGSAVKEPECQVVVYGLVGSTSDCTLVTGRMSSSGRRARSPFLRGGPSSTPPLTILNVNPRGSCVPRR